MTENLFRHPLANGTSYKPGQRSANPGGRPKSAEVSALARRYTPDAITALVELARDRAPEARSTRLGAASKLVDIGYPGLARGSPGAEATAVHLHLLAVQAIAGETHLHLTGEPVPAPAPPEIDLEAAIDAFPSTQDDLPPTALPLWDAARVPNVAINPDLPASDREIDPTEAVAQVAQVETGEAPPEIDETSPENEAGPADSAESAPDSAPWPADPAAFRSLGEP